jgi:hypothetical protein
MNVIDLTDSRLSDDGAARRSVVGIGLAFERG